MFTSFYTGLCSMKGRSIEDATRSAPCPPPMIPYLEFRDHALNNSLLLKDVCIIARRCYTNSILFETDCPIIQTPCTTRSTTTPTTNQTSTTITTLVVIIVVVIIIGIWILSYIAYRKFRKRRAKYSISKHCRKEQTTNDDIQCPETSIHLLENDKDINRSESVL